MLSKEQNELLCRVGPGTPMGNMLRQYWTPALRSAKLVADGAPERVRLFGQNFVAFRDTNGKVGFLDEGCPHRGVSLALGRNEECGLRCIFHGWKINVDGQVVEVPSEPAGSNLASKVRVNHYPVREAGGMVWVYLGKEETLPPFPAFEFTNLPPESVVVRKALNKCNWVQALEGLLDSSHVHSLHKSWLQTPQPVQGAFAGMLGDSAPRFEVEDRPYGLNIKAKRVLGDGTLVNRYTEYALPTFCFIPNALETLRVMAFPVAIDDYNTWFWEISYNPTGGPMDAKTSDELRNVGIMGDDPDNYYQPAWGPEKVWGQDREMMRQGHFTGFIAFPFEDFAVQESQGALVDRSKEHLGMSDVAVIRARRLLLEQVQKFREGEALRGQAAPVDFGAIHGVHEILPAPAQPHEVNS